MIEETVKSVVAQAARLSAQDIDISLGLPQLGVDSLGILVVRENLERELSMRISDGEWLRLQSVADIVAFARRAPGARATDARAAERSAVVAGPAAGLGADGLYRDEIEIGMPLTGRNNLAEGPLLQRIGHLRWQHMSAVCGVPSRDIADEDGHRLYATFFFVDLAFPPERPMASFGENERLRVESSLCRFGESMLDGIALLVPSGAAEPGSAARASIDVALAAGLPAVRMSNIFVRQFAGAGWLKKSRPAHPAFARIRELATPPDSLALAKQAEKDGSFELRRGPLVPLSPAPVRVEYALVPDRDLNGAGLVYFAHYPVFADIAEREVLRRTTPALPEEFIDRRTVVRRRAAYLNNAASNDRLEIHVQPFLELPSAGPVALEATPPRLVTHTRISRLSDGRAMYVATAEKVVSGRLLEDWPEAEQFLGGALAG